MFKKNEGLFLVHHNGYFVSRYSKSDGSMSIDKDIEYAKVFKNLKLATKVAMEIQGEIFIYSHDMTTRMYGDLQFTQPTSDEMHP